LRLEVSTNVAAPPERVWATIIDFERWPEWTPSVTRIERLEPGELKAGSKLRIKQPKLPTTVWTVSLLEPGSRLEWQATSPGSNTVAWHAVEAEGDGSKATLGIDQTGVFFALTGWYFNRLTREYVDMELAGLKKRSEETSG
jgi:carbon monoxide dehydrogenase subunit G